MRRAVLRAEYAFEPMDHPAQHLPTCYNCGASLTGAYCAACGQKSQPLDPPLSDVLHELSDDVLHVDSKLLRSAGVLLAQPGVLTKDYFAGKRIRWISPLRLYLAFSAAYFGYVSFRVAADEQPLFHLAGYAMFLLVPLYAALIALVAPTNRNYPQHLYFALHVHAAWFAAFLANELLRDALSRFTGNTRFVGQIIMPYVILYPLFAYTTAYGDTLSRGIVKTIVVLAGYAAALTVAVVAIGAVLRWEG